MMWRSGYSDFFHDFRGQECIIVFRAGDDGDWWIAPLNDDGCEGEAFQDLTDEEENALALLIGEHM
jgi:hypothetical protein